MASPQQESWLAEVAAVATVRGVTVAAAESLSAGCVQSLLARRSGASAWFAGGVTAYNLEQKATLLRVSRDHAATCNCVSQRVADEMADHCRRLFAADVAVSTTGYAEPPPTAPGRGPFAHLALADRGGVVRQVEIELTAGNRNDNQQACAWAAIELLASYFRSLETG